MPAVEGHVALVASTGLLLPISAATVLGAKQLDTSNNPILWRFAARGFGGPVLGLTGVAAERFRWPQAVVTGGTQIRLCRKPATTAVFTGCLHGSRRKHC